MTLREQKLYGKHCQPLELLMYFGKGFRYFHTFNVGSIGQLGLVTDPVKLLAFKVRGHQKKSAALAITAKVWPVFDSVWV